MDAPAPQLSPGPGPSTPSTGLPAIKGLKLPRRKRTNTIPYDSFFAQEVKRFINVETSYARQSKIVNGLDVYIRADYFIYPNKTAEQMGKGCLIQLWTSMLNSIEQVPASRKGAWYEYMVILMNRYEFDLIHLLSRDQDRLLLVFQNALDQRLCKLYRKNLVRTVRFAVSLMGAKAPASAALAHATRQFFVKVLATSFFRLPILCGLLLDAACRYTGSTAAAEPALPTIADSPAASSPDTDLTPPSTPPPAHTPVRTPPRDPTDSDSDAGSDSLSAGLPDESAMSPGPSRTASSASDPDDGEEKTLHALEALSVGHGHHRTQSTDSDSGSGSHAAAAPPAPVYHQLDVAAIAPLARLSGGSSDPSAATPSSADGSADASPLPVSPVSAGSKGERDRKGWRSFQLELQPLTPTASFHAHMLRAFPGAVPAQVSPIGAGVLYSAGLSSASPSSAVSFVAGAVRGPPDAAWKSEVLSDMAVLEQEQLLADKAAVSQSTWFFDYNPSLFQWTSFDHKDDAQLMDAVRPFVAEQLADPAFFFDYNPSLFQWTSFDHKDDAQLMDAVRPFVAEQLADPAFFFDFFHSFVAHVAHTAHGEVRWSLVPGYWTLVTAFVQRLVDKSPPYPPSVVECITLLLQNPELLPLFVRIVLRTTRVSDKLAINQVLDLFDSWFTQIGADSAATTGLSAALALGLSGAAEGPSGGGLGSTVAGTANGITVAVLGGEDSTLPYGFCFGDMFTALDLLLDSEHFQILLKTLWFLYMHAGRFVGEERATLFGRLLLGKYFFKLFLHWCPEVRRVFHYILVYKVLRTGRARTATSLRSSVSSSLNSNASTPVSRSRASSGDDERIMQQYLLPPQPQPCLDRSSAPTSHFTFSRSSSDPVCAPGCSTAGACSLCDACSICNGANAQSVPSPSPTADSAGVSSPTKTAGDSPSDSGAGAGSGSGSGGLFSSWMPSKIVGSLTKSLLTRVSTVTSSVTHTVSNTLTYLWESAATGDDPAALMMEKYTGTPSTAGGTLQPHDPKLDVCTEIVTLMTPRAYDLDHRLMHQLQHALDAVAQLSRFAKNRSVLPSRLLRTDPSGSSTMSVSCGVVAPILRPNGHVTSDSPVSGSPVVAEAVRSTDSLPRSSSSPGPLFQSVGFPPVPVPDPSSAHSSRASDSVLTPTRIQPRGLHGPADRRTPSRLSPRSASYTCPYHQQLERVHRCPHHRRSQGPDSGTPLGPAPALGPSPQPSPASLLPSSLVSVTPFAAQGPVAGGRTCSLCAQRFFELGISADMVPYAMRSLKEYDSHMETFRRLQWFVRHGGVVTPDLYFEIAPDRHDDL